MHGVWCSEVKFIRISERRACAMFRRSFFISTFVTRSRDESIHLRVRTTQSRAEDAVLDMFDYLAARMLAY